MGASADKVVSGGSLYAGTGVKKCTPKTRAAEGVLPKRYQVQYRMIPFVMNHDRTGMCPVGGSRPQDTRSN